MEALKHNLKVTPYEYQQEGILFGLRKKRFLIGDEPGLGKTLQSIGVVDCARAYPCLVICPSSLKINWQREFEKFADVKALVLDNATRTTFPYLLSMGMYQVAIVNFESLRKYFVWDIKANGSFRLKDVVFSSCIKLFKSVIIDESHRVKDPGAQQTIFTKGICSGKRYIALLSGTPVVNRPEDLVAQLSIMERLADDFGGRGKFLSDYCSFGKDQEEEQAEALADLSRRLYENCMIRREKKSVLTELPEKTRTDLYVELDPESHKVYDTAAADLREYLEKYTGCTDVEIRRKMRMEALVKFMTLRSLSAKGKVRQAVDFVNTFLANGKPLILFCSYHEIVDALKKAFPKAVSVTGRDSLVEKQAAVDSFQNGHAQLIVCSIKVQVSVLPSRHRPMLRLWNFHGRMPTAVSVKTGRIA